MKVDENIPTTVLVIIKVLYGPKLGLSHTEKKCLSLWCWRTHLRLRGGGNSRMERLA